MTPMPEKCRIAVLQTSDGRIQAIATNIAPKVEVEICQSPEFFQKELAPGMTFQQTFETPAVNANCGNQ